MIHDFNQWCSSYSVYLIVDKVMLEISFVKAESEKQKGWGGGDPAVKGGVLLSDFRDFTRFLG